ncbi:hypothetical protein VTP01DRAFT_9417 [Rhizomucor pusillus]|uniref:uncharacterized protein n=1 Tax=Rhizomucor pusillus TaxID=4840 RepID=UPI003742A855
MGPGSKISSFGSVLSNIPVRWLLSRGAVPFLTLNFVADMTSVLTRHLKYQPSRASPSSFLPPLAMHHFKSSAVLLYFNRPTPRVQTLNGLNGYNLWFYHCGLFYLQ